ncbi:MAG: hypothetical protein IJ890_02320 [Clostridia bacterium]|nr:hypothetical protein [Clostridia bacterium]
MEKKNDAMIEKVKNVCIIVLSIILFIYLVLGINSMMHGEKMGFFNLRFYIMSSDSKEANTTLGDLVIAKKININKIKENDNIIYKRDNKMFIKKVIKIDNEQGSNIFVKEDDVISNEIIENAEIMGKVLTVQKGFGNIALFIKSPIGAFNMLMIMICVIIIIKKLMKNSKNEINESAEITKIAKSSEEDENNDKK